MRKQSMHLQNSKLTSRCCRRMAALIQNLSSFEYTVYSFGPGVGKAFSSGVCNWAILVASQGLAQEIVSFGRRSLAQLEWCKPGLCSRGDLVYLTSHCGNTIGCGVFDQQPWRLCGCAEGAIKLFPCKAFWLQWLLPKASRRSQLWPWALSEKLL